MIKDSVIILCGGRGRRLGALGESTPKALAKVHGQPILWYALLRLHKAGFRHFILPLGFRGPQIQAYIDHTFGAFDARIDAMITGEDTEVGKRIHLVRHLIADRNVLVVNGDTLFDFDIAKLMADHSNADVELTLTSCQVVSQYGLLLTEGDRIVDFTRDSLVGAFQVEGGRAPLGYINAGITVLRRDALDRINLETTGRFEEDLFPHIIAAGQAMHRPLDGYWHAIDTQKDLDVANAHRSGDPRAAGAVKLHETLLQYAIEIGVN